MVVYDETYFTDGGDLGGYDNYNGNPNMLKTYAKLIEELTSNGIDVTGRKVLDIGCAQGFLVEYLVSQGIDAYGMDSSVYALSQVPEEIADRIMLGDITASADYARIKELAGLTKKNDKFDLIIDQNVIICLNDADAIICCDLLKDYGDYVIHFVNDQPSIAEWYNHHTIEEWIALVGMSPTEKWFPLPTWSEL